MVFPWDIWRLRSLIINILSTNSTFPSLPSLPSIPLTTGYDFWLAFVPAILVFVIGFIFRHSVIAIVLGVAMIIFGPVMFPSIFDYAIFSYGTMFSLTGLTLVIYITFFCAISYFREMYGAIIEPLGIWGSFIVIVLILAIGYVIGRFYPDIVDSLLHSSFGS